MIIRKLCGLGSWDPPPHFLGNWYNIVIIRIVSSVSKDQKGKKAPLIVKVLGKNTSRDDQLRSLYSYHKFLLGPTHFHLLRSIRLLKFEWLHCYKKGGK